MSVEWLQAGIVVDGNYSVTEDGEVYNSLQAPASRADLKLPFVCRAGNNDLERPDDVTYTRNVTCEYK